MFGPISAVILGGTALYEGVKARQKWIERRDMFIKAQERAIALERPLLVVGNPDAGIATRMWRAYQCGDLCVDLTGCPTCPVQQQIDITKGLPEIPDNSAVVYVSCVLEYTNDPEAAAKHLMRVAGAPENLFLVTVDPNTLTSYLYPGAKYQLRNGQWQRIDTAERVAVGVGVGVSIVTAATALVNKARGK